MQEAPVAGGVTGLTKAGVVDLEDVRTLLDPGHDKAGAMLMSKEELLRPGDGDMTARAFLHGRLRQHGPEFRFLGRGPLVMMINLSDNLRRTLNPPDAPFSPFTEFRLQDNLPTKIRGI